MTARLLTTILSRLLTRGLALVAAVTVMLVLLRAAPGDAIDLVTTDPELRTRLAAAWHLDAPLHIAVRHALTGTWGTSWTVRPGRAVSELVGSAALRSFPLLVGAFLATFIGGTLLGSRRDRTTLPLPRLSVAPVFLLGWGTIVVLNELTFAAIQQGLIGRPAWFSLPDTPSWTRFALAVVVLAVGSGNLRAFSDGVTARLVTHRSSPAIETLTARAMPTRRVLWRLLLPDLVWLGAERAAFLFGGLVVLERVFGMPGLGWLLFEACVQRDQPVVLASGVVAAASVEATRVLADSIRIIADPRLRDGP